MPDTISTPEARLAELRKTSSSQPNQRHRSHPHERDLERSPSPQDPPTLNPTARQVTAQLAQS